jgi:hypothetical protein
MTKARFHVPKSVVGKFTHGIKIRSKIQMTTFIYVKKIRGAKWGS